jgi:hypothetical protein
MYPENLTNFRTPAGVRLGTYVRTTDDTSAALYRIFTVSARRRFHVATPKRLRTLFYRCVDFLGSLEVFVVRTIK